jgi:hypothetical protein
MSGGAIWMNGRPPGVLVQPAYAVQLLRQAWCDGCAQLGRTGRQITGGRQAVRSSRRIPSAAECPFWVTGVCLCTSGARRIGNLSHGF